MDCVHRIWKLLHSAICKYRFFQKYIVEGSSCFQQKCLLISYYCGASNVKNSLVSSNSAMGKSWHLISKSFLSEFSAAWFFYDLSYATGKYFKVMNPGFFDDQSFFLICVSLREVNIAQRGREGAFYLTRVRKYFLRCLIKMELSPKFRAITSRRGTVLPASGVLPPHPVALRKEKSIYYIVGRY